MLKIEKYVIKEIFPNILTGLIVFTLIFILDKLFSIANLIIIKGVGIYFVIQVLLLSIPAIISITFPMAVLLGNLLGFSRLTDDNEITAMITSGIKYTKIFYSSIVLSLLFSILFIYYNFDVAPKIENKFNLIYSKIMNENPGIILKENIIQEIKDSKIFISKIDYKNFLLNDITIFKIKKGLLPTIILSKKGKYRMDSKDVLKVQLSNGNIFYYDKNKLNNFSIINFENFNAIYNISSRKMITKEEDKSFASMTAKELNFLIKKYNDYPEFKAKALIQYHLRISIAFAIFFLSLVAIPLGMEIKKKNKPVSFAISLFSIFLYYIILIFCLSSAEKMLIKPVLAVWIPNIFFLILSIIIIIRKKIL